MQWQLIRLDRLLNINFVTTYWQLLMWIYWRWCNRFLLRSISYRQFRTSTPLQVRIVTLRNARTTFKSCSRVLHFPMRIWYTYITKYQLSSRDGMSNCSFILFPILLKISLISFNFSHRLLMDACFTFVIVSYYILLYLFS